LSYFPAVACGFVKTKFAILFFQVRARTQEGFGPYSYPVQTKTLEEPTTVAGERAKTSPPPGGMDVVQLLMAVIGGVLLVVAVVAVIIFCLRCVYSCSNLSFRQPKIKQPSSTYATLLFWRQTH